MQLTFLVGPHLVGIVCTVGVSLRLQRSSVQQGEPKWATYEINGNQWNTYGVHKPGVISQFEIIS